MRGRGDFLISTAPTTITKIIYISYHYISEKAVHAIMSGKGFYYEIQMYEIGSVIGSQQRIESGIGKGDYPGAGGHADQGI